MGREIRADYEQMFLLPPSLEDWVPADHPARFIRDFVDSLDLEALGFRIPEADEGRPPYACDLLLKVWVYGYMNKIRHTRPLEAACREQMSLIWLTGANYPDHNTLWRFWAVNREALRGVFKRATWVAHKAGLVGLVVHALDGTKIAADVSRGKIWRRGELEKLLADLDAALEEIMGQTERAEGVEDSSFEASEKEGEYCLPPELRDKDSSFVEATSEKEGRRQKIREALAELDRAGRDYLHPVDADARLMRNGDGLGMAYNAQVVVDQSRLCRDLIVAQDVVNEESDSGQLVSMLKAREDNLGVTASETLADAGYYAPGELAEAEEREMRVLVSMPREPDRRWNKGEFQKSNFKYDQKADVYTCPSPK